MTKIKRVGILTGGGDCPGLNPAIRWFVEAAHEGGGIEVLGLRQGWKSLCTPELAKAGIAQAGEDWWLNGQMVKILTPREVDGWERIGGTFLGSSRTNPFSKGNDQSALVLENIAALGLDALVAIGGEDTLGVARRLHAMGVPVVGIPKTIDADLPGTEYSLGFASAVQIVSDEIDRLRTTAGSHSRFFVVEVMGRHAGHLALEGGLAGGADIILIPEMPFEMSRVVHLVTAMRMEPRRYGMVVVAEGAFEAGAGGPVSTGKNLDPSFGHVNLGGVGELVSSAIARNTGYGTRSVQLSHIQRGGAPCSFDRIAGMKFGFAAAQLVAAGISGRMVAMQDGRFTTTGLEVLDQGLRLVNLKQQYDEVNYNGRAMGLISCQPEGGAR